jgi:DNA-binding YbaB/EbfC family protein
MDENNNLEALMAQLAQAQSQLESLQDSLGDKTVEAEVGGGAVKVVCNGKLEVLSIKIDPKVIDPKDPGMLEDLVLAGVKRALSDARDMAAQAMSAGMFPGGMPGMP